METYVQLLEFFPNSLIYLFCNQSIHWELIFLHARSSLLPFLLSEKKRRDNHGGSMGIFLLTEETACWVPLPSSHLVSISPALEKLPKSGVCLYIT